MKRAARASVWVVLLKLQLRRPVHALGIIEIVDRKRWLVLENSREWLRSRQAQDRRKVRPTARHSAARCKITRSLQSFQLSAHELELRSTGFWFIIYGVVLTLFVRRGRNRPRSSPSSPPCWTWCWCGCGCGRRLISGFGGSGRRGRCIVFCLGAPCLLSQVIQRRAGVVRSVAGVVIMP